MLQRRNSTGNGRNVARSSVVVMDRKSHGRSRVSNGSDLFVEAIDGRSTWARRFRDLIELHAMDLGGSSACSEAHRQLIRRCAALEVELERLEGQFAQNPAGREKLDLYQRMTNTLRRTLQALGLNARS